MNPLGVCYSPIKMFLNKIMVSPFISPGERVTRKPRSIIPKESRKLWKASLEELADECQRLYIWAP
jgi:hypothetical protein